MTTTTPVGSATFGGPAYRAAMVAVVNTADTALALKPAVAAGDASAGEAVDKNVLAFAGVIPFAAGDAMHLCFAKSGTISSNTIYLAYWRPIMGANGCITGYAEFPLCDVGATLTFGSVAIGAGFTGVALATGLPPTTAPAGTEVWASGITAKSETVPVTTGVIINNMDLMKTADDGPCVLRITPMDGATHLRVGMKTGGGGGTMWAFAVQGRGASLNK